MPDLGSIELPTGGTLREALAAQAFVALYHVADVDALVDQALTEIITIIKETEDD